MATQALQAILDQDKPAEVILQEAFDYSDGVWNFPGKTVVLVAYRALGQNPNDFRMRGREVASYRLIRQDRLSEFSYDVTRSDTYPCFLTVKLHGHHYIEDVRSKL